MDVLAIDVSSYDVSVDYLRLAEAGVDLLISKADNSLQRHAYGWMPTKLPFAVYHWHDPIVSPATQAKKTIDAVKSLPIDISFIAVDFEQWWRDWGLWYRARRGELSMKAVPRFSDSALCTSLLSTLREFERLTSKPIIIYTAAWFVDAYAPSSVNILRRYPLWLAEYRTLNMASLTGAKGRPLPITQLRSVAMRYLRFKPRLPRGLSYDSIRLVGHQCSGDNIFTDAVFSDSVRMTHKEIDINWFDREFVFVNSTSDIPVVLENRYQVVASVGLNVRSGPGTNHPVLRVLKNGTIVNVESIHGDWAKLFGKNEYVHRNWLRRI